MKFPNHLVLDINNYSLIRKNQHWSNYYVLAFKTSTSVTPSAHSCSFSKRKNNVIIKNARMVATGPTNYFLRILRRADFKLSSSLFSSFNMNFLKKEKLYTKLKYSRVPQYDIVSGGVAALFAGFLGFLICEKFGFELLDSGDFYFLFMYLVFFFFFL